jgi:hypothetical protein
MPSEGYNDNVFVNCPFDDAYKPLLYAIVYTIYRCGFVPQSALGEDDATVNRLDKISRCMEECKYGIHDISRIELNANGYPRFNMPFELGIFFGAKKFGNSEQKNKNALVFERVKYTYQEYISDLNGVDTKAHGNKTSNVIRQIRNWLQVASKRKTIPGHTIIEKQYKEFKRKLPKIVSAAGLDIHDIPFNDFCQIVEDAVREKLAQ